MRRFTCTALAAATLLIATAPLGAGAASAEATMLPLSQKLRRCDFTEIKYVGGAYYGRAGAQLRAEGGELTATVEFATGVPNTRYEVRLIQMPRTSAAGCSAGDPGVAVADLFTDSGGAGTVTVRGPLMRGATGAWLSLSRPSAFSQQPAEFYTSDFIATL